MMATAVILLFCGLGYLLANSPAVQNIVNNILTGGFGVAAVAANNATVRARRIISAVIWAVCIYAALLAGALFSDKEWLLVTVTILGTLLAIVCLLVCYLLQVTAQAIQTHLHAWAQKLFSLPWGPAVGRPAGQTAATAGDVQSWYDQLPDPFKPEKATGILGKIMAYVLLGLAIIVLPPINAAAVGLSVPLKAAGLGLNTVAGLAAIVWRMMRRVIESLAWIALVLLFITAGVWLDLHFGWRLAPWFLGAATLAGALYSVLTALKQPSQDQIARKFGIPVSALWFAAVIVLLVAPIAVESLLSAAFPSLRSDFNKARNVQKVVGEKGPYVYGALTGPSSRLPCYNCAFDDAGQLKPGYRFGAPIEIQAVQAGTWIAPAHPKMQVITHGHVLWLPVHFAYGNTPRKMFNEGQIWLVYKDDVDYALKAGERLESIADWLKFVIARPLMFLGPFFLLLLGGLAFWLWRKRRPNQANQGETGRHHATNNGANGHGGGFFAGVHPLALIIGGVVVVYGALCTIPATISLILYYLVHRGQGFTSAGAQSLVTMMLLIFGAALIMLSLVFIFSRLKRLAFALLLLGMIALGVRSVLADNRQDLRLFGSLRRTATIVPGATSASVLPSISRPDFAQNLRIVDEELAAHPQLAAHRPFVLSLIKNESDWDVRAKNPKSAAAGLMQLVGSTQRQYGVANPYDARQNVRGGLAFLADLHARYGGDWPKMLLAYAWGPQNVPPETSFEASMAGADRASPESATAVRRILARAAGQQPKVRSALTANGLTKTNGGWQIRALANQANPLSLELPAGRYEVTVTSPDGILWDPNAPRVFVDAQTVEAKYRFRPEEFPLGELGVCKPVLLTSIGKIGLGSATQRLDLNQPTKIEGVVQNNRPQIVKASRGHWIIRIIPKEG